MKTLNEVRTEIDRIDREMKALFQERMSVSEQVVRIKAETRDEIYKPDREAAIIEKQSAEVCPEFLGEYRAFVKHLMGVSRNYQYGRMSELYDDAGIDAVLERLKMCCGCGAQSGGAQTVRIAFSCGTENGRLAGVLAAISEAGVNLMEIVARRPESLNGDRVQVTARLELDPEAVSSQALILRLSKETEEFRILES